MAKGAFITFEGGEGAGKSTQIERLAARLKAAGVTVITTREPGGTSAAEEVRALLVTGEEGRWDAMSEALLLFAARRNHVKALIKPSLDQGKWVISDRFVDSTMAYQGVVKGLGEETVQALHRIALGNFAPDLTLILDLDPALGLKRSHARNHAAKSGEDRFERMGESFHQQLHEAYHRIAAENPERCRLIDASGGEEEVAEKVWQIVAKRFKLKP